MGDRVLNKLELIRKLEKKCNLAGDKASEVIEKIFKEMTNSLVNGERIEIRDFCSFSIKNYKPYTGRNPKTGKAIQVSAKKLPFFKYGKELKERVNCRTK